MATKSLAHSPLTIAQYAKQCFQEGRHPAIFIEYAADVYYLTDDAMRPFRNGCHYATRDAAELTRSCVTDRARKYIRAA